MPPADRVVAFAIVSVVFVVVPGPSVLYTVSRALTLGRRAALLNVLGNSAGVYVHVIAVAVGVAAIVERSIAAFTILKLVGAAYLIYLGVEAIRTRHSLAGLLGQEAPAVRGRRVVADGFIVGISNPKSIVFFAAVLPQFVEPAAGRIPAQLLLLGAVSIAAALLFDSLWALVAGTARDWFGRSPRRLAAIGGTGGLVMVGLGVRLAFTGRKD